MNFTLEDPGAPAPGTDQARVTTDGNAGSSPNPEVMSGPDLPSFDVVRIDPQGNTVMAGRAGPGATVIILDGAAEIGRVIADGRGEWVFIPSQQLSAGTHELSLQVDREGQDSLLLNGRGILKTIPVDATKDTFLKSHIIKLIDF